MYCSKCGKELIVGDSKFCTFCGNKYNGNKRELGRKGNSINNNASGGLNTNTQVEDNFSIEKEKIASESRGSRLKNIGRWIATPFAWIGGGIVGSVVLLLFNVMPRLLTDSLDAEMSLWNMIIANIVAPLVSAFLGTYWGVKVAPSQRELVALILFVLTTIIAILVFIFSISEYPFIWSLLYAISVICGSAYVVYMFSHEGKKY